MKRTKRRRTLSLFLVIVLIASLFGLTAQAVGNGESTKVIADSKGVYDSEFEPADDQDSGSPNDQDSDTPNDQDSDTPNDQDSDTPNDQDSDTPKDQDSDTPKDQDSDTPNDQDSDTPNDQDSNTPKDQDSDTPKDDESQQSFTKSQADVLDTERTLTQKIDGVTVSVKGCFPVGVELQVVKAGNIGIGHADFFCAYKISLQLNGEAYEMTEATSVSITGLALPNENMLHLQGVIAKSLQVDANGQVYFETDSLAAFLLAVKTFDLTGTLTVTKTFSGLTADEIAALKDFKITVKGPVCGSAPLILSLENAAQCNNVYKWTLSGLMPGLYSVSESGFNIDHYKVDFKANCIPCTEATVLVTKFCTSKVAFVNSYSPVPPPTPDKGTLTVTKTFKDLPLDKIPDDFIITVNGADCENQDETRNLNLTGLTPNNGVYTWTLSDLKPGDYTVTESGFQVTGYSVAYQVNNTTGTSTSVTISKCSATKVAFVNIYKQDTPPTPTGTLTVTKTFSGNGGNIPADFAIVVNGASYPLGEPSEGVYTWDITLPVGEYTVTETNTAIQGYTLDTSKSTTSVSGTLTTDGDSAALENVYSQCACRYVTVRYEYIDPVPTGAKPPNDGNPIEIPYNSPYDSITPTSLDGYKFDGWYVKNETPVESPAATISSFFVELFGKDDKFVDNTPVTSDIVLYGYWIKTYKVKYTWGTGAPSDAVLPSTASYEKDEEVEIAAAPTTLLSGWTFNGWKINGEPASKFTMGDSDVDIVGSWTQTIVYPPGVIYPDIPTSIKIPEESPPLNPSPSVSPDPGAEIPEEEVPHADAPVIPVDNNKPQTGDNSNLALMTILAALSSIGIGTVSIIGRRKKNSK